MKCQREYYENKGSPLKPTIDKLLQNVLYVLSYLSVIVYFGPMSAPDGRLYLTDTNYSRRESE